MIGEPVNDEDCLGALAESARKHIEEPTPALLEQAGQFEALDDLAEWFRAKPQRDDTGKRGDGPKVEACDPDQRLRVLADDPNCFERSHDFAVLAHLAGVVGPEDVIQFRTENTPMGMHTFPLVNGEAVALSPNVPRNAITGAIHAADATASCTEEPQRIAIPLGLAIDWIAELATERASLAPDGAETVTRARVAMHAAALGAPLPPRAVREVATTIALAERAARSYGADGVAIVRRTAAVLAARTVTSTATAVRNLSLRFGGYTIRPDWDRLARLGGAAGNIGQRAGWLALRGYLGQLGIGTAMLGEIERELGRQGLTLGPLATEPNPAPGTLSAAIVAALT